MNAMQLASKFLPALFGALLAAGCASVETAPAPDSSPESPAVADTQASAQAVTAPPRSRRALPEAEEEIEYGSFSEDVLTRVILAEMAGQRGYNRQALEEYAALARETRNVSLISRAARIAAFLRDVPVSLEMADLWLEAEPESGEARQALALQMLSLGRYREAMTHLTYLLEAGEPVDFRMITARTVTDRDAALFLDALTADFEALLERHPGERSLRLGLAHLYQQGGEPRQALALLRGLDAGDDPEVVILESQLLEAMGDVRQARRRLEQSLNAHPDDSQLRFLFARALIEQRNYTGAREQFTILVEQDPQDFDMLYSLALINMELDRIEDARRNFESLVESPHRADDAHYYLAMISEDQDRVEDAIEHFKQVDGGGNFLEAQRKLTEHLVARGRYPEARERLQRVRLSNSDYNIPLLTMEASVLMDGGHLAEAERVLDGAVGAFPNDVQLLYLRSVLSTEINDLDTMERDLRRIIELNPESPVAYNSLGYILADRTKRYDEAYELIQKAIALAPDDPAIIDSLGWVQYRLGMYEEARRNLDRAFELYPDHEVAAHLGEVLWVLGEKDEAHRIWRDALEEQPDSEPIRDAIERLTPQSSI